MSKKERLTVRKRIYVVDDHPITRRGLTQLINHERDLIVCGEADSATHALEEIPLLRPDLILLDLSLPRKSGLTLLKEIRALCEGVAVLVLSMHDETIYAERVLRAGGRGYIMKNQGGEKLLQAIRQVLEGKIYVSENMSVNLVDAFAGRPQRCGEANLGRLTDREFEVFQLVGEGLAAREIGQRMHLSPKTVDTHRLHIKDKLRLPSLPDLRRYAVRWAATQDLL